MRDFKSFEITRFKHFQAFLYFKRVISDIEWLEIVLNVWFRNFWAGLYGSKYVLYVWIHAYKHLAHKQNSKFYEHTCMFNLEKIHRKIKIIPSFGQMIIGHA